MLPTVHLLHETDFILPVVCSNEWVLLCSSVQLGNDFVKESPSVSLCVVFSCVTTTHMMYTRHCCYSSGIRPNQLSRVGIRQYGLSVGRVCVTYCEHAKRLSQLLDINCFAG